MTIIVKDTKDKYQLVILHPSHFSIGGGPIIIKHPETGDFEHFYASNDGVLREGSLEGAPLPPLFSRNPRAVPLNPVLVNITTMIRLRRLIRQNPTWGSTLDPYLISTIQNVVKLHEAVIWRPGQSHGAELQVEFIDPGSQQVTIRDLRSWPFYRPPPT